MLTRENIFSIGHEAYLLCRLPKGAVGRQMRRFLLRVTEAGMLFQSFAFEQGYSVTQLYAIEAYARTLDESVQSYLPLKALHRGGTVLDECYGLVSTHYKFVHDISTANVSQLRDMVKTVAVLAQAMQPFAASVNATALLDCPTYVYRGLPCNIADDSQLWVVGGTDRMTGGGGVLEWCYDLKDAIEVFDNMMRNPGRFDALSAHPFVQPVNHCAEVDLSHAYG